MQPVAAKLREGTEILRTGGGTTLNAGECHLLLNALEAARDLYEAVEGDESVGVCLTDRVPSLRLGDALSLLGQL